MPHTDPDLYCFLGKAIAGEPAPYRSGARHALVAFTAAPGGEKVARALFDEAAQAHGWQHLQVIQSKPLPAGTRGIDPGPALEAAETALRHGASVLVHPQELPADA